MFQPEHAYRMFRCNGTVIILYYRPALLELDHYYFVLKLITLVDNDPEVNSQTEFHNKCAIFLPNMHYLV